MELILKKSVLISIILALIAISAGVGIYLGMSEDNSGQEKVFIYPGHVKVLQYNIDHGLNPGQELNLHNVESLILQEKPDIVCLNSIDQGTKTSGYINQPRKIREAIDMPYSYGKANPADEGWSGNAIFTRFPIKFAQNILFQEKNNDKNAFLYVIIGYEDIELHVITTSLDSKNYKVRIRELQDFIKERELTEEHIILTGTFTIKQNEREIKDLSQKYHSIFNKTDLSFTYPSSKPEFRHDYMFVSKNIKIMDARVINSDLTRKTSQHLPITANINIQ